MEPSGRNRRPTPANRNLHTTSRSLQTAASACRHLPREAHGKEGVDGSSPSEGFDEAAVSRRFYLVRVAHVGDKGRTGSHDADSSN